MREGANLDFPRLLLDVVRPTKGYEAHRTAGFALIEQV